MPNVRDPGGRRIRELGLPDVRVSERAPLEASGGGPAAADAFGQARGLAQDAERIRQEEHARASRALLASKHREANDWELSTLDDPKKGVLLKRGKDALGIEAPTLEAFDKFAAEQEKTLGTNDQVERFREQMAERRTHVARRLGDHVGRQAVVHGRDEFEAFAESSKDRAARDPSVASLESILLADQVELNAERLGMGPEMKALEMRRHESELHARVLSGMFARGEEQKAAQYFTTNREYLAGRDLEHAQRSIEEGSVRILAQRQEDRIVALGLTPGDALKEARKLEGKERDLVLGRLMDRFRQDKFAEAEQQERLYEEAVPHVDANPGVDPRASIPPHIWSALSSDQQDALKRREETGQHNSSLWLDFVDLASADPLTLASLSRGQFDAKWWTHFDARHRAQAEEAWSSAREAVRRGREGEEKLTSLITPAEVIKTELRRAGILPWKGDLSEEQAEKYANFEDLAQKQINHFERTELKGARKASRDEVRKIVTDELAKKVMYDRNWPIANEPRMAADLLRGDRGNTYVQLDKIPAKELEVIRNRLKARGGKYSDDKAERLYAAQLLDDVELYEAILNEKD